MSKESENRFIAGAQAPKQVHPFLSGPKSIAKLDRRQFLKLMAVVSAGIAIAPWIPSGAFLLPGGGSVLEGGEGPPLFPRKIVANVNDESQEGGAIGETLLPGATGGRSLFFLYPDSSDPELTNVLIHLPPEDRPAAGGNEYVAYNRTCIHLRCLVPYVNNDASVTTPNTTHGQLHCPCHGSVYDPSTARPIAGPAHNDPSLGRPLPQVIIEQPDSNGDIYARGIIGTIGYGRTA